MAERLIRFATEHFDVFRANDGQTYGVRRIEPGTAFAHGASGSPLMAEIKSLFHATFGKWPDSKSAASCADYLTVQASRAPAREVAFRSHWNGTRLLVDVGDDTHRVIEVDGNGWRCRDQSEVPFRRSAVTATLATPAAIGDLDALWRLVNIAEVDRPLVVALLICAWLTGVSQPIVYFTGPQDAGKTEAARFLLRIVDPVSITERGGALPANEQDWKARVRAYRCVMIDNASRVTRSQSDTLCKVATGGEAVTRTLYSDDSPHVSDLQVPVWLTSIGVGALAGDLGSRLVKLELAPLDVSSRMALTDLREAQTLALPGITRALLDLAVQILAALPVIDRTRLTHRLTDFELTLRCIDKVLGTSGAKRLTEVADDLAADVIDADPVAQALLRGIETPEVDRPLLGEHTAADLLAKLRLHAAMLHMDGPTWPRTPALLSSHLRRIAPALKADQGITVSPRKSNGRKIITVSREVSS